MKDELAITLRAVRELKGARYDALAGTISQSNLSLLEQGKIQASLPTLLKLADTLDMSLLTILALCLAIRDQNRPEEELEKAMSEVRSFVESGGLLLMEDQIQDGTLRKRTRGTKADAGRVAAVSEMKHQGKTQAETARALGLPKSTVQRYWLKS